MEHLERKRPRRRKRSSAAFLGSVAFAAGCVLGATKNRRTSSPGEFEQNFPEILQETEELTRFRLSQFPTSYRYAPIGVGLIDNTLRYVTVTPTLAEIDGHAVEEHLGHTIRELVPAFASALEQLAKQVLITGQPIENVEQHATIATRPEHVRHWIVSFHPVRNHSGAITGVNLAVADVTETRHAEEELRLSEKRFRTLIENSSDIISLLDTNGTILYKSPSIKRILGFEPRELIGHNALEVAHPDDFEYLRDLFRRLLQLGPNQTLTGEFRHLHKDGSFRQMEGVACNMLSERAVAAIVFTFRDVTERKQAQEALEKAQDDLQKYATQLEKRVEERTAKLTELVTELERFSYTLAHDMRSPLRSMKSFAQMLEESYSEKLGDDGRQYIEWITHSAGQLENLITDALNYSKITASDLVLEPVDVSKLVEKILTSYPNLREARRHIHVQPSLPVVQGNPAALTQCILNLLTNALKFVPPSVEPEIRVEGDVQNGWGRLCFRDNGIGIAPENQERIFQLFERVSGSDYEGTGIGLSIVSKALERMGGKITLDSALGKGSAFCVELPLASASPTPAG